MGGKHYLRAGSLPVNDEISHGIPGHLIGHGRSQFGEDIPNIGLIPRGGPWAELNVCINSNSSI